MNSEKTQKKYYFVDESGDQNFLGKHKVDLIKSGKASKYFIVGYIELEDHLELARNLGVVRESIKRDDYLQDIPSLKSSLTCFHANKDCREVQERVFKVLKQTDFQGFAVVIEKKIDLFISKFKGKKSALYAYLVERLFENRLHQHDVIDIYFSKVHNVIHEKNMWAAIEEAKARFYKKWNKTQENDIRIFMQNPSQIAGLQAVDYFLWMIHRLYHHHEFRYYHFLQDKVSLIHDLSYGQEMYGEYFSKKNPITKDRFKYEEKK